MTKYFFLFLIIAALGGVAGWFAHQHRPAQISSEGTGRKVLYYQSSMHPWIKSDKPGKCTICGMDLVPVYEGEKGFDGGTNLVTLSPSSINVLNVQTKAVRREPLRRMLRVAGMIEENDTRHRFLSTYVDGRIDQLFVNYVGAEVVEGQSLAKFYSTTLLTAEREYISLLRQSIIAAAPDMQTDQRRLLSAARQRLKQFGLTEDQINALARKTDDAIHSEITAPMTGTVVARHVYEGQYVKEGDKLFEIADFSTMWLLFDAYERDLAWIKVGQKVDVTTPAVPGKDFSGKIAFIDPNIREATRSAKVRVEIPNPLIDENGKPRRALLHKLYAEALVQVELPEVLAVTRGAVLSPGAQPVVYIDLGNGSFEPRRVKLGRAGDELWEVLDGLAEGEQVVTTGNLLIDAQAQLNQSVNAAGQEHGASVTPASETAATAPPPKSKLTEAQKQAAKEFLAIADGITAALASDDLKAFNQKAAGLHAALPALLTAFDDAKQWHPLIQGIEAHSHFQPATELKTARKAFYDFSMAVVEFAKILRQQPAGLSVVKIYQCPMLKTAFPGAPNKGLWLQTQGPLRNPYFGAEMIDCGTEVKP